MAGLGSGFWSLGEGDRENPFAYLEGEKEKRDLENFFDFLKEEEKVGEGEGEEDDGVGGDIFERIDGLAKSPGESRPIYSVGSSLAKEENLSPGNWWNPLLSPPKPAAQGSFSWLEEPVCAKEEEKENWGVSPYFGAVGEEKKRKENVDLSIFGDFSAGGTGKPSLFGNAVGGFGGERDFFFENPASGSGFRASSTSTGNFFSPPMLGPSPPPAHFIQFAAPRPSMAAPMEAAYWMRSGSGDGFPSQWEPKSNSSNQPNFFRKPQLQKQRQPLQDNRRGDEWRNHRGEIFPCSGRNMSYDSGRFTQPDWNRGTSVPSPSSSRIRSPISIGQTEKDKEPRAIQQTPPPRRQTSAQDKAEFVATYVYGQGDERPGSSRHHNRGKYRIPFDKNSGQRQTKEDVKPAGIPEPPPRRIRTNAEDMAEFIATYGYGQGEERKGSMGNRHRGKYRLPFDDPNRN